LSHKLQLAACDEYSSYRKYYRLRARPSPVSSLTGGPSRKGNGEQGTLNDENMLINFQSNHEFSCDIYSYK